MSFFAPKPSSIVVSPSPLYCLVPQNVRSGDGLAPITVGDRTLRVGRAPTSDITLTHPSVSWEHALLRPRANLLHLEDLGSTNGTFVNGNRIAGDVMLREGHLVQFGEVLFRLTRDTGATEPARHTAAFDMASWAAALVQFDTLMREPAVVPHYQPIVAVASQTPIAYEVLGRSRLDGLRTPAEMFEVASELGHVAELSRLLRDEGVRQGAASLGQAALFLNTHPEEIGSRHLLPSLEALRRQCPGIPLVLEVHECALAKWTDLKNLRDELAAIGVGLAFDDFGAGTSRLVELTRARPHFVKFDREMIRQIDRASQSHRDLVRSLVRVAQAGESLCIAEGVETQAEHETVIELGFRLAQGFWYGRPVPADRLLDQHAGGHQGACANGPAPVE